MTQQDTPHADHAPEDLGHPLVSNKTMEIVTSLCLLGLASVAIYESVQLGFGWEADGPASGFFPFIVAVLLAFSCVANLVRVTISGAEEEDSVFVTASGFGRVLSVFLPLVVYVAGVQYLGIYVASAIFIGLFMLIIGKESILKCAVVGLTVSLIMFLTFERWFLVPLPKGPLEAWLGY